MCPAVRPHEETSAASHETTQGQFVLRRDAVRAPLMLNLPVPKRFTLGASLQKLIGAFKATMDWCAPGLKQ